MFQNEMQLLLTCQKDLNNPAYKDSVLLPKYKELILEYEKLLKVSKKIFKISDTQGRVLKKREYEIKNLLDNANQGFLTCGKDLIVDKEYSAECIRIFCRKICNLNIVDLLIDTGSDFPTRIQIEKTLSSIFNSNDVEEKDSLLSKLPHTLFINDKNINVEYKLIGQEDNHEEILFLILTDVTEKIKSDAQIEYLSFYDSLTSLYNRAYIDRVIPEMLHPENLPFSIILADINGLKLINDVFGHEKGDQLIIDTANVLKKSCRKTDVVARWGGDEFLIILPNTNEKFCQEVVTRINNLCQHSGRNPIAISVAMGTATVDSLDTNFCKIFGQAENKMYKNKLLESKAVRHKIIMNIEKVQQERGFETQGHVERVRDMAVKFAKLVGVKAGSPEMNHLMLLVSLHDVGKVAIPEEILLKPSSLIHEEWEIIKSHSEIGYRMAQSIGEAVAAEAILALRERWDGNGYPRGLKGEEIPYMARLLAIVDSFDVMTHDRIYKRSISVEEAKREVLQNSGTQFDPFLTKTFLEKFINIYEQ
ncbi:diguanylate cyclase domain-containing protein [Desulforamulus reducens]|uniref:bifunctional diguanylate cyclase/phosphohydrolase n=1 Tax=Desulforamulus reducens TaxID=59610 RepID=UPI0018DD2A22|nr:diguanylate cyclase [Desulforamulus reducens]